MSLVDLEQAEFDELLAGELALQEQHALEVDFDTMARRHQAALQFDLALDERTEKAMRKALVDRYRAHVQMVPGHRGNSPGPDALALVDGRLYIVDNKGGKAGRVGTDQRGGAGGLSALSLTRTLPALAKRLKASPDPQDLAMLALVEKALTSSRQAVSRARAKYRGHPRNIRQTAMASARMRRVPNVHLLVTNAGGRSTAVSRDMDRLGVKHLDVASRVTSPLPRELAW